MMMTWKRPPAVFIPTLALILFAASSQAQNTSSTAAVDQYVKAEMQRQHIPGLSLLVAKNGKIVQAEGFGLSNVELQVPVKPESVFQSGSVGKQFTATAVMMLVEDGKVKEVGFRGHGCMLEAK